MPGNDPVDNGQPHAGAAKFIGAVQALEYTEQLIIVLHAETDAVIPD